MMYLILDRNPVQAALLVSDRLKFKQLLELAQMISTITNSVYKPISQGKEIMQWIKQYPDYTKFYFRTLYKWCEKHIKMKDKTKEDLQVIYNSLEYSKKANIYPETAIFRFSKYYDTDISNNSELPIDIAIKEYRKYLVWKELNNVK